MSGPLRGMRVLDLSQQLPGPYATLLLASLGATVTKVEPPGGDAARELDPEMFERVNAGKKTVLLNLKSTEDKAALLDLVRSHDVFVEGFRPGVTARLGCDAETLRAIRPSLVYCSISGAGQTGPLATQPTHDISLQAMAGVLAGGGEISRIGVPWVDLATGTSAALAITAAWHQGTGAYLDLSMLDSAVAWASAKPSALDPGPEPAYGTLSTSDGRVVIALLEDGMWVRLCAAFGWTEEPRFARYADRRRAGAEIRARLEGETAVRTTAEVLALAEKHDLPIHPAAAADEPATLAQLATRLPADAPAWRRCVPLPETLLDTLDPAPTRD